LTPPFAKAPKRPFQRLACGLDRRVRMFGAPVHQSQDPISARTTTAHNADSRAVDANALSTFPKLSGRRHTDSGALVGGKGCVREKSGTPRTERAFAVGPSRPAALSAGSQVACTDDRAPWRRSPVDFGGRRHVQTVRPQVSPARYLRCQDASPPAAVTQPVPAPPPRQRCAVGPAHTPSREDGKTERAHRRRQAARQAA